MPKELPALALVTDPLFQLLQPARRVAVVDIGANPIDGEPPYKPLLEQGLCTVVGFEPQPAALAQLQQQRGPLETYLPDVVGDGAVHTLHICAAPGMTSLLQPDPRSLALFQKFSELGQVVATESVPTRTLDDIEAIEAIDFLKIDVQGSELSVFRSGRKKLSQAVVIQTEVSFLPLYQGQPPMGAIDLELREQGFLPHAQLLLHQAFIAPMVVRKSERQALHQLVEADLVYVRDFRQPIGLGDEQLKQLALIAHHCYQSYDLAVYCILELERRGCLSNRTHKQYLSLLPPG